MRTNTRAAGVSFNRPGRGACGVQATNASLLFRKRLHLAKKSSPGWIGGHCRRAKGARDYKIHNGRERSDWPEGKESDPTGKESDPKGKESDPSSRKFCLSVSSFSLIARVRCRLLAEKGNARPTANFAETSR